jgi:GDP-mannose transporter
MVFYNNVLSLPLLLGLAMYTGEIFTVLQQPALRNPSFLAAALVSALCGFLISFCSLWFLSTTTATTYSLVGSLNKIPIATIGLLMFEKAWRLENVASVAVGLVAGVIFVRAKALGTE